MNSEGQLGIGEECDFKATPQLVKINEPVNYISCGHDFTLVVTHSGKLFSFGMNDVGQLGDGTQQNSFLPVYLKNFNQIVSKVACGANHSMILTKEGKLYSCGWGQNGILGQGHLLNLFEPTLIQDLQNKVIVDVACGASHTLCLSEDGVVYSFGDGSFATLGHGTFLHQLLPSPIDFFSDKHVIKITCGVNISFVIVEKK